MAAALLAHGLGLANGFVYDDHRFVDGNPALTTVDLRAALLDPATHSADSDRDVYRPLRVLGHAFDARRWGLDPFGFHLHSVLAHLLAVWLAWRLLFRLLGARAALFGAGALAFHPAGVEVVGWVSSRGDEYALIFGLMALDLVLERRSRALPLALAALAAAAATLGKESAAVIPAVAGWHALLLDKRRPIAPSLALGLGVAAALVLRQVALGGASPVQTPPHGGGALAQLGWSCYGLTRLVEHLLWPPLLSIDPPQEHWVAGWPIGLRPRALLGVALLLSPLALSRRRPRLAFLAGWAGLAWLPSGSLLVTLRTLVTDRTAYPMLAPLGALLGRGLSTRPRLAVLLGAVLAPVLILASARRTLDFRDDGSLWSGVLERQPASARARLGLASVSPDPAERERLLADAVDVAPAGSKIHAVALARLGDLRLSRDADPAQATQLLAQALGELQAWAKNEGRPGRDLSATAASLAEALVRADRLEEAHALLLSAAEASDRPLALRLKWALLLRARARQLGDPDLAARAEQALLELEAIAPDDPLVTRVRDQWAP